MNLDRIGECLARGVSLIPHLIVLGVVLLLLPIVLPIFVFLVALGWVADLADEYGIIDTTAIDGKASTEGEDE